MDGYGAGGSGGRRKQDIKCILYNSRLGGCYHGDKCHFSHSIDLNQQPRTLVTMKGEFPQREGTEDCKNYYTTGTCYYGTNCRFNHPPTFYTEAPINQLGFPMRMGVTDCPHYMERGICGFGFKCKFNHPQPSYGPYHPLVYSPATNQEYPNTYEVSGTGQMYSPSTFHSHFGSHVDPPELLDGRFPIRQGEQPCPFYMNNGSCKYGSHCRFDHPPL